MPSQSLLANETLWGIVNALFRLAASLFLHRLFPLGACRISTSILAIVSTLHGLATFLEVFLICHPISAGWDLSMTGDCGNQVSSFLILEIIGLLIDVVLLIIPPLIIRHLQMSFLQKLHLSGLFLAGSL